MSLLPSGKPNHQIQTRQTWERLGVNSAAGSGAGDRPHNDSKLDRHQCAGPPSRAMDLTAVLRQGRTPATKPISRTPKSPSGGAPHRPVHPPNKIEPQTRKSATAPESRTPRRQGRRPDECCFPSDEADSAAAIPSILAKLITLSTPRDGRRQSRCSRQWPLPIVRTCAMFYNQHTYCSAAPTGDFGRIFAKFGRLQSNLAQRRPTPGQFCKSSADVAENSAEVGPISVEVELGFWRA